MKKRVKLVCASLVVFTITASAQQNLEVWPYKKPAIDERHVVPHRYTREASAKYHKRIHRIIDVREKQNLPMHWPTSPLYNIIYDLTKNPIDINFYTSDSLENGGKYSRAQIADRGSYEYVMTIMDENGDPKDTTITIQFEPENIKKYRIMEDWIFDNNYSDFRVTIVAIAPQFMLKVGNGVDLGEASLFWMKMDDLRPILVNREVFNPYNDAARLSFDDWFEMRMFSSYIVRESNVWNDDIKDYEENEGNPFSALLHSEAVKQNLFVVEHDLWEY